MSESVMKISYLDGRRLYYAFLAGGNEVIKDKDYLNKINVFPVPDADTGTNLASTMRSIARTRRRMLWSFAAGRGCSAVGSI